MIFQKILKLVRSNLNLLIPLILLLPLYVILYKIYIPRVNAFGCFDLIDDLIFILPRADLVGLKGGIRRSH